MHQKATRIGEKMVSALSMAGTTHLITRAISSLPPNTCRHYHNTQALAHQIHLPALHSNFLGIGTQQSAKLAVADLRKAVAPIKRIRAMAASSGPGLEEGVKKAISENPVVVYSKTWCPYSSEVKSLFKGLGVQPLVVELDQLGPQGPELQQVLESLTGQPTVPNVFIGGKHVGGCTDTVQLYEEGELESLLSEAGAKKAES
ncbi:monothiol glutaredoxin-S10-like [Diospyros lotus]|uniref:monothiol glutaredoxin-S10-like n=1 Tax=Diospyros lotus TaxID=55363 RepID=UPI00225599C9|nr:monothiol glutaredoxin-S10-like [Diospyros lotus]